MPGNYCKYAALGTDRPERDKVDSCLVYNFFWLNFCISVPGRYTDCDKCLGTMEGCLAKSLEIFSTPASTAPIFYGHTPHTSLSRCQGTSPVTRSTPASRASVLVALGVAPAAKSIGTEGKMANRAIIASTQRAITTIWLYLGRITVEIQDWFHRQLVKRYEERHGRLQRLEGLTHRENWI